MIEKHSTDLIIENSQIISAQKYIERLDIMVHACIPETGEEETEES
jgi:hypothetical protein